MKNQLEGVTGVRSANVTMSMTTNGLRVVTVKMVTADGPTPRYWFSPEDARLIARAMLDSADEAELRVESN